MNARLPESALQSPGTAPDTSMNEVNANVRLAVSRALPSRSPLIGTALALLLTDEASPIHAKIVCSIDDGAHALNVGAALNLIQIGLQRLHVRVDRVAADTLPLDQAASVLVGDYLTSGAFKLIATCPDFRVLRAISVAMTATCELETAAIRREARADVNVDLHLPLGKAAGKAAGLLASHDGTTLAACTAFGAALAAADALVRRTAATRSRDALCELRGAAQAALKQAGRHAQALREATGNARAPALVDEVAQSLERALATVEA
jgi:octaprenyl-diphosphate synthase